MADYRFLYKGHYLQILFNNIAYVLNQTDNFEYEDLDDTKEHQLFDYIQHSTTYTSDADANKVFTSGGAFNLYTALTTALGNEATARGDKDTELNDLIGGLRTDLTTLQGTVTDNDKHHITAVSVPATSSALTITLTPKSGSDITGTIPAATKTAWGVISVGDLSTAQAFSGAKQFYATSDSSEYTKIAGQNIYTRQIGSNNQTGPNHAQINFNDAIISMLASSYTFNFTNGSASLGAASLPSVASGTETIAYQTWVNTQISAHDVTIEDLR